jgi:hypothetical protein
MPNPVLESAVESIELEAFSKNIPDLIFKGTTAYSLFKNKADVQPISNVTAAGGVTRPSWRLPMRIQGGAPITQGTGNADSMLRGSGSNWQDFALSPVWVQNVCEVSFLAQEATKSRSQGLFKVQAQELKNSLQAAMQGIEGLITGDGSGAIDQIPTTATITTGGSGAQTSVIAGINVAAAFTDQQVVQFVASEGGTIRTGTATISFVDAVAQTLYFSTALPSGTTYGDYILVNGSSGVVGSSILGYRAWQVNSNTGTIGGLSRSTYPGRLSTPTINLGGGGLTPGIGQRAEVLLGRALGPDNKAIDSAIWFGAPEQAYAVSNLFYGVQISGAVESQAKSENVPDMGKKYFTETFGAREFQKCWTAQPNRLDLLLMDTWALGELRELSLLDFGGGLTVVPTPDTGTTNGTYLNSSMFSYAACFQLANSAPRAGLYVQNIAVPTV